MGNKTQVLTAHIVFEATDGNDESLRRHVINAVKSSCRNARSAAVAVVVLDENGDPLGSDYVGNPSKEMQEEIDVLYEEAS